MAHGWSKTAGATIGETAGIFGFLIKIPISPSTRSALTASRNMTAARPFMRRITNTMMLRGGATSATERIYARVYTVGTDKETLKSVRVFVASSDLTIEIDCVSNFDSNNPGTGYSFSAKGKKETTYPGWYTIDLTNEVELGDGRISLLQEK